MRRIHPKLSGVALIVAAALAVSGCGANQQTASINPFLSPDRVPPPATRPLMPGAAQPYYPGDPLPTMQSATNPSPSWPNADDASRKLAATREAAVSIPADSGALRFVSPSPQPEPAPFTDTGSAPIAAVQSPRNSFSVATAGLQQPSEHALEHALHENTLSAEPLGPWRSPRVPVTNPWTINDAPRVASMATPPVPTMDPRVASHSALPSPPSWSPPPSTMGVQLRAVPSPPPAPVGPTTPRIRLPGAQLQPQAFLMPDGTIRQVNFIAPPAMSSGTVLPTTGGAAAPPPGYAGGAASIGPPLLSDWSNAIASRDGFRPRGSTR